MSLKRTILKTAVFGSIFMLFLTMLLLILLNSAPFQNWAVDKVTKYLSAELKTRVQIGKIRFKLFHTLSIEELLICDQLQDTLLYSQVLDVKLKELDLDKGSLLLEQVNFKQADIALKKRPGIRGLNIDYIINYFAGTDTTHNPNHQPFTVNIRHIRFTDSRFSYYDLRDQPNLTEFDESRIDLRGLNMELTGFKAIDDSLSFNMKHFSATDRCGFRVDELSADVIVSSTTLSFDKMYARTPNSELGNFFSMNYSSWDDFDDFENLVKMNGSLEQSKVNLKDIAYFAEELAGYDLVLHLDGDVKGPLSYMKGKKLRMSFGEQSFFDGDLSMRGLPNFDETFIDLKANKVQTIEKDLLLFLRKTRLPVYISKLGRTSFSGRFTGFYTDFVAYGKMDSELGQVKSDINLKIAKQQSNYKGKLELSQFDLGRFWGEKSLGKVSVSAEIQGQGFDLKDLSAELSAHGTRFDFYNYSYSGIKARGKFDKRFFKGNIDLNDPNLVLNFNGNIDFRPQNHIYDFSIDLHKANLKALRLDTNNTSLSAMMRINFTADKSFVNNEGSIAVSNILIQRNEDSVLLNNFQVTAVNSSQASQLELRSDLFDLELSGRYNLARLDKSFMLFMEKLIPAYIKPKDRNAPEQNFRFTLKLKKSEPLFDLFYPELAYTTGYIKGAFNSSNGLLELNSSIDSLYFHDMQVKNLLLNITKTSAEGPLAYNIGASTFNAAGTRVQSPQLSGSVLNNRVNSSAKMNDPQRGTMIDLNNLVEFNAEGPTFTVLPSKILLRNRPIQIEKNGFVNLSDSGIFFSNIYLHEAQQSLLINGLYKENGRKNLHADVKNLRLETLSNLLNDSALEFDGTANGQARLSTINGKDALIADLNIKQASVNKDTIGDIDLSSTYESLLERLNIHARIDSGAIKGLTAKGYINLARNNREIDIDVNVKALDAKLYRDYLLDVFPAMVGTLSADLKITGTLDEPQTQGLIRMKDFAMQATYLNTIYYVLEAEIEAREDLFTLKKCVLIDNKAKQAELSGWLSHKHFTDFKYRFDIENFEDFWMLNTEQKDNELFYGKGFGSGNVKITGSFKEVDINANIRTSAGTKIFMPLNNAEEAEKSDFVRFISIDNWKQQKKTEVFKAKSSFLTMNFNLEATPDAEMQLIFNSKLGDVIKGKGRGNLKMELNKMGDFLMYGEINVEEGAYLFTALSVINKRFVIQKGSTITWNGDPLQARMDMTAIYKLRTTIPPLYVPPTQDDIAYKRRVPVECKLLLKGNLFTPEIRFDINLPELNNIPGTSTVEVQSALQQVKTNSDEMNRQFFSLLVAGSFSPRQSSSIDASPTALSSLNQSAGDFISNQLSNVLSQIDPNWEIGINYQLQDATKQREMIVSLTRRFLDDRLEVQTSADFAKPEGNLNITAKYDLTKDGRWKAKAFNTNNNDPIIQKNILTQGVGLLYRVEFNKLSDLKRKNKDRKRSRKERKKERQKQLQEDNDQYIPVNDNEPQPNPETPPDGKGD